MAQIGIDSKVGMALNEYLSPRKHSSAEETTLGCKLSRGPIMEVSKIGWRLQQNLSDGYQ